MENGQEGIRAGFPSLIGSLKLHGLPDDDLELLGISIPHR